MTTATPTERKIHKRFIELEASKTKEDPFHLSFSSETPVERGLHKEVLSHTPSL